MTPTPEPTPVWPPERLRIGDCTVDVPLREVHAPGARRPSRITPKSLGVMLALARQPGRVVSREALLDEVWPDTMPTDDVVTQAITQLRKAFGEQRGDARYIETIAKNGYRLLATVERLDPRGAAAPTPTVPAVVATQAPSTPVNGSGRNASIEGLRAHGGSSAAAPAGPGTPTAPAPLQRSRRAVLLVLALFCLPVLVLALFALSRGLPWRETARPAVTPTERPYRLITSAPGFELNPTLSPDASMVAYAASLAGRRGTAIMVQTTQPTSPRQLTRPEPGQSDRLPAWSPNGRDIAFQRVGPDRECRVLVMPASGGAARGVAGCDIADMISFSWTPDSTGLLFGSMRTYDDGTNQGRAGIRELDLASGRWRAIDYSAAAHDLDYMPRYSPDGRWIVFIRNPQLGDLWRIPASGGTPTPLTRERVEIRGWDWLPDGSGLVFGRRVDAQTRVYRLDLARGTQRDLGVEGAQLPSVARRADAIAFVHRRPEFGLFRFDIGATGVAGARVQEAPRAHLFASSGRDTQPSIAPDATQLAFTSDRSGSFGLWWADLRRADSLRLIDGIRPDTRRLPEWSWDARRLLVAGTGAAGRYGLHEIDPASGQVSRLPVPAGTPDDQPIQGLYLPDPGRLLVGVATADGRSGLVLYDRSTTPWRALAALADVSLARVDPERRRVLFTRLSGDGLWQIDFALSAASLRKVDETFPSRWRYRNWDIAGDGRILYVDQGAECLSLLREIAVATPPSPRCLQDDRLAATNGLSVSGRERALFVALPVSDGADIAFMAMPPAPATEVPGLFN